MKLEEKSVLLSRWNVLKHWNDKEWWYTGVYDPRTGVFFAFYFTRVNITDHFSFTVFDPAQSTPKKFSCNFYLDKLQEKNKLCLNYRSRSLLISYNGDENNGWKFKFENKDFDVELDINAVSTPFTKFDNNFVNIYSLMHFFHSSVKGYVKTKAITYSIDNALCYYDHCFGRVPRRSGWHWLAVQDSNIALASLVNYGPYPQKYTQVYFKEVEKDLKPHHWYRLNQDVSFEHDSSKDLTSQWKVTSPDMDLTVTPLSYVSKTTKIPPFLPFLIKVTHSEIFVKASGFVRVDGIWIGVEDMYGIMEEHYGKW